METWLSPGKGQAGWHVPRLPASLGPWVPPATERNSRPTPPFSVHVSGIPGGSPGRSCSGFRSPLSPGFLFPLQDGVRLLLKSLKLGPRPLGLSGRMAGSWFWGGAPSDQEEDRQEHLVVHTLRGGGRGDAGRWGRSGRAEARPQGTAGSCGESHPLRLLRAGEGVQTPERRTKFAAPLFHTFPNGGARLKVEGGEDMWNSVRGFSCSLTCILFWVSSLCHSSRRLSPTPLHFPLWKVKKNCLSLDVPVEVVYCEHCLLHSSRAVTVGEPYIPAVRDEFYPQGTSVCL